MDYSASGETEILRPLIRALTNTSGTTSPEHFFVEFGGSRGYDGSNCLGLADMGKAVLIEADHKRFKELTTFTNGMNILCVNEYVGVLEGKNRLDDILRANDVDPERVAVVSIDVDGDDALIFENLGFKPPLVVVEYNPSFPYSARFRNPNGKQWGNSLGELRAVASELGYFPHAITRTNILFSIFEEHAESEEQLWKQWHHFRHSQFGFAYDGTLVRFDGEENKTTEIMHHGWSDNLFSQPVPKRLRKFNNGGEAGKSLIFVLSLIMTWLRRPISTVRAISNYRSSQRTDVSRAKSLET